jgi:hypothetical protein
MARRDFYRLAISVAMLCLTSVMFIPGLTANAVEKKSKKKPKVTTTKPKKVVDSSRRFSCLGTNEQRVTERLVTGTVNSKIVLTNVSVTQNFQLINNILVEQPVVVLTAANPPGEQDPGSDLIVFRLNERLPATAADVDKLFVTYRFNFKNTLPPGPTFVAGLYFTTHKGTAGPAVNEYRWSLISSLASSGAYSMNCQYL